MRIDHIAFRVANKPKAIDFFTKALGYSLSSSHPLGFKVDFDDGTFAECSVLEPQKMEKCNLPWVINLPNNVEYHLPPEIFVSQGSPGSIVDNWVRKHGSGLHHIALLVDSVEQTHKEWLDLGFAEFTTEQPIKCPGLTQIFTQPSQITGIIWELIEREGDGFCASNVKNLMESSVKNKI